MSFDWFSEPINSSLKFDYISVCMTYSGLPTKILDKNLFQFDLSKIKGEMDFYYLASIELIGEREYFGHDLHTFKDCLLEVYKYNGFFENKSIKFINSIQSDNIELSGLFEEIKSVFKRYKFSIE